MARRAALGSASGARAVFLAVDEAVVGHAAITALLGVGAVADIVVVLFAGCADLLAGGFSFLIFISAKDGATDVASRIAVRAVAAVLTSMAIPPQKPAVCAPECSDDGGTRLERA